MLYVLLAAVAVIAVAYLAQTMRARKIERQKTSPKIPRDLSPERTLPLSQLQEQRQLSGQQEKTIPPQALHPIKQPWEREAGGMRQQGLCESSSAGRQRYRLKSPNYSFAVRERNKMSASLRYDVLARDGFRCQICGATQDDGRKLHVDHIVPVSHGGRTEMSNLRTLCDRCNLGKGSKIEIIQLI